MAWYDPQTTVYILSWHGAHLRRGVCDDDLYYYMRRHQQRTADNTIRNEKRESNNIIQWRRSRRACQVLYARAAHCRHDGRKYNNIIFYAVYPHTGRLLNTVYTPEHTGRRVESQYVRSIWIYYYIDGDICEGGVCNIRYTYLILLADIYA